MLISFDYLRWENFIFALTFFPFSKFSHQSFPPTNVFFVQNSLPLFFLNRGKCVSFREGSAHPTAEGHSHVGLKCRKNRGFIIFNNIYDIDPRSDNMGILKSQSNREEELLQSSLERNIRPRPETVVDGEAVDSRISILKEETANINAGEYLVIRTRLYGPYY